MKIFVFGPGYVGCVMATGFAARGMIGALAQTNGRLVVGLVRLPDAVEPRGSEDHVGVAW
jgi:hypothetical protein